MIFARQNLKNNIFQNFLISVLLKLAYKSSAIQQKKNQNLLFLFACVLQKEFNSHQSLSDRSRCTVFHNSICFCYVHLKILISFFKGSRNFLFKQTFFILPFRKLRQTILTTFEADALEIPAPPYVPVVFLRLSRRPVGWETVNQKIIKSRRKIKCSEFCNAYIPFCLFRPPICRSLNLPMRV